MPKITADMAISLDGYIAGPNGSRDNPLGEGGERIHEWQSVLKSWRERQGLDGGKRNPSSEIVQERFDRAEAVIMGRRMFDNSEGPWGDPPFEGYWGDDPPFRAPVFVLTHHPREQLVMEGGTTFTFVTDGVASALEQAQAAAGDGDVSISGGANVVQQYLRAGLLDELELDLVPVLLGDGIRLFNDTAQDTVELETTRVVKTPEVTHIRYRL